MKHPGSARFLVALLVIGCVLAGSPPEGRGQVPAVSDVYVDRGILAYDAKRYAEALEAFQEALRLDPDSINALYYAGLTHVALEQYPEAQRALERAQELAPGDLDVAFQLGVVRFSQQQYEGAEPVFRRVHAAQPTRQNLGYYLGFLAYRKQAYREALQYLRANAPSDETFAQLARFYAGLSLSALGLAGQARAEIEEAIRLQPISPLTGPAERFRDVLGAAAKAERTFRVDVKLSAFYDDNVPVNPEKSEDASAEEARKNKHRSTGELGFVRFEYTPLRTAEWEGSLGYSLLQTINNDVAHYNVQNHTGTANLAYKTSLREKPAVWSLTYQYDYLSLDDRNFVNRHTVAPGLSVVWDATQLSQFQARFQSKDFMHEKTLVSSADDRDAHNLMAGFTHFLRFAADQHYLKMGYQLDVEAAHGNNWSYLGHRFLLGGQYTLPWEAVRVRYDFDVHLRDYLVLHSFLPTGIAQPAIHRSDRDMNHQLSISKEFPGNVTLSLEYLFNRNFSNLALFDYTRNVVSLSVSWRY